MKHDSLLISTNAAKTAAIIEIHSVIRKLRRQMNKQKSMAKLALEDN